MRLNIGCGPVQPDEWVNLDPDPRWKAPLREIGALSDGSVEGAVAHHVLQMVPWPELVPWLAEVRRVLRPGGYLRLSVPDLALALRMLNDLWVWPPIADEHEKSLHGKVCMWLSQAGASRSVFTGPWVVELCQRAGFSCAGEAGYVATPDAAVYAFSSESQSSGPRWLTALDLEPDRRWESVYVDAVA